LRGLWNRAPQEGDQFVNIEVDWLVSPPGNAVQFSLSGNSPVAISQIVALSVDNSRSGADVDFVFPDSGFVLTVPAHNQLVAPVFTNALMFYAVAQNAILGDTTVFQILNSMPPPVPIAPSTAQNHISLVGVNLANGTTPIIVPLQNGTLNSINVFVDATSGAGASFVGLNLIDGRPIDVWSANINLPATTTQTFAFPLSGMSVRFVNGLNLQIAGNTFASGSVNVNLYYSVP
jgi:hypothetical protein